MTVTVGSFARFQADWRARRRAELAAVIALRRMRRPTWVGAFTFTPSAGSDACIQAAPPRTRIVTVQPPIGSAMTVNTRPGGWNPWLNLRGFQP